MPVPAAAETVTISLMDNIVTDTHQEDKILRHPLRDTCVFHASWLKGVDMLKSDSDKGIILTAILEYALYNNCNISFDKIELDIIWAMVKDDIDRDIQKYAESCKYHSANGKKGGRPKKHDEQQFTASDEISEKESNSFSEESKKSNSFSEKAKESNEFSGKAKESNGFSGKAKKADNDYDYESDNDSDSDNGYDSEVDIIASTDFQSVLAVPLNDGTGYPIFQKDIDHWQELYPAVDILQELRNIIGWCEANTTKRKTKKGVLRFINSWLSKKQNSGGSAYHTANIAPVKTDNASSLENLKKLHNIYSTGGQ